MTQTPGPVPPIDEVRAENIRLRARLAAARLESANRLAAIRAALGAAEHNETDPLGYLRDQLAEENASPDPVSGR